LRRDSGPAAVDGSGTTSSVLIRGINGETVFNQSRSLMIGSGHWQAGPNMVIIAQLDDGICHWQTAVYGQSK